MGSPDIPLDWWKYESTCRKLSQCFGDHTVLFVVGFQDDDRQAHAAYTGFLYRHRGIPFWVSAGHVFKQLEGYRNRQHSVLHSILADKSKARPDGDRGIPVDLDTLRWFCIDRSGMDLGFMVIRPYYLHLLEANQENRFLDERIWHGKESATPEGYYLVGFPEVKHEVDTVALSDGETLRELDATLMCLPLERIPDCPGQTPATFWGVEGAFYGKLVPFAGREEPPVSTINYMSGGPIFSIERAAGDKPLYRWFGVQTSWLPKQKIVRAASSDMAVALIEGVIKQARETGGMGP